MAYNGLMQATANSMTELGETSAEVKQYERLKLKGSIGSLLLTLLFITVAALWFGPILDGWVRERRGDIQWLRLISIGFSYAAMMEVLRLPLAYWSGCVLEHHFGLSNQTFPRW